MVIFINNIYNKGKVARAFQQESYHLEYSNIIRRQPVTLN